MNNQNLNKINCLSHDTIDFLQKIGHEIVDTTFQNGIPIINTLSNLDLNLETQESQFSRYSTREDTQNIYIYLEMPGVVKEKCIINFSDGVLKISGKTNIHDCNLSNNSNNNNSNNNNVWNFIDEKKYYREINLTRAIIKDNIDVNLKDGVMKIIIKKQNENLSSNINIK